MNVTKNKTNPLHGILDAREKNVWYLCSSPESNSLGRWTQEPLGLILWLLPLA